MKKSGGRPPLPAGLKLQKFHTYVPEGDVQYIRSTCLIDTDSDAIRSCFLHVVRLIRKGKVKPEAINPAKKDEIQELLDN